MGLGVGQNVTNDLRFTPALVVYFILLVKWVDFILFFMHNLNVILSIEGGKLMKVNTNNLVSITEANRNFSRVARMVDEHGSVIILKNNSPRYLLIEFGQAENEQIADNEDLLEISRRLIAKNREAYEVLAK